MTDTQPGGRRDAEVDLSALRLERRADGQLWLMRDGGGAANDEAVRDHAAATDGGAAKGGGAAGDGGVAEDSGVAKDDGATKGNVAVRIAPCFPWSRARQYISVRTSDDKEVALIRTLDELAADTRALVEEALAEIGFVLEITRVLSIRTEVEIRNWQVETRQGACTFQTKLDDWPHPLGDDRSGKNSSGDTAASPGEAAASPGEAGASPGAFILRDVAGNLFLIPDPATLDAHSRKLLWPFIG